MIYKLISFFYVGLCLVFFGFFISCSNGEKKTLNIIAGGASFPAPLYQKWFLMYEKKTGVSVNYQATGSGAGQKQLESQIFHFAGSDAMVSDEKIAEIKKKGQVLHHFPSTLTAISIVYHLNGIIDLKLTPEVLADIYLGHVTRWDDEKITAINPEHLDELVGPITVVHRSDGSGTTAIFSDYLSKVSDEWRKKVGAGKSLKWPASSSLGGKKSAGVAGVVINKKGAIGYVSLDYALSSGQPVALIKNKSGNWIRPSVASAEMASAVNIPPNTMVMLTDTDSPEGYPITGFTWILFMEDLNYRGNSWEQAKAIKSLFEWILSSEAQSITTELNYVPLSPEALERATHIIAKMRFGEKLL